MSFKDPIWLLALLAIPAIWLLYIARRARAARFAVRFPAAATLSLAAPVVAAWRRHLPALLTLAAIGPLAIALARPEMQKTVPVERASIVLVTDHSGSMNADDVEPTRLDAAKKAANTFVDELPARVRLGIVTFAGSVDAVQAPSTDHDLTRRVVDAQVADGSTATGDGLKAAVELLGREAKGAPTAIVLLSDGKNTIGQNPVAVATQPGAAKRIPIYTVGLGTEGAKLQGFGAGLDVSPDFEALAEIADVSGGRTFSAGDSGELEGIYEKLGSQLGTRKVPREVTAAFAAVGLALLVSAGIAAYWRPMRIA